MSKTIRILVIDDEPLMRITIQDALEAEGYKVTSTDTGGNGLSILRDTGMDIIITDLKLPDIDGIGILKEVKKISPDTQVIMITAYGSIDSAITAMKEGAVDYLTKPFSMDELLLIINRTLRVKQLEEENISLRKRVEEYYGFEGIVGKSPQMQKVYDLIE